MAVLRLQSVFLFFETSLQLRNAHHHLIGGAINLILGTRMLYSWGCSLPQPTLFMTKTFAVSHYLQLRPALFPANDSDDHAGRLFLLQSKPADLHLILRFHGPCGGRDDGANDDKGTICVG